MSQRVPRSGTKAGRAGSGPSAGQAGSARYINPIMCHTGTLNAAAMTVHTA